MSRQTRKWLLVLIVVPAVLYGVARVAVWYTVTDTLGDVREALAPVANLEHTKILSPVFGAFGVTGITITPHILDEGISIGSALVNTRDPIEKFRFVRARMEGALPTSFSISLNNVRVPLGGEISEWLGRQTPAAGDSSGTPAACRAGAPIAVRDLKAMGYGEIVGRLLLDYHYDRRNGGVVVYASVELRDMFEVALEGRIPPDQVLFAVDRIRGVPSLSDLSITLSDASWTRRFNRYCADSLGITEAEYVQRQIGDMRQLLEGAGLTPSEALMAGLERVATGAASLTLSLNPRSPLEPTRIPTGGDAASIIDRLGIEVLIDGKPIQDLGAYSEAESGTGEVEEQVDETYKPTPLSELPQYLASRARIVTRDGKVHRGYLDSIDSEKVVMTRHLEGGSATFDVERKDIEEVLVLRP